MLAEWLSIHESEVVAMLPGHCRVDIGSAQSSRFLRTPSIGGGPVCVSNGSLILSTR